MKLVLYRERLTGNRLTGNRLAAAEAVLTHLHTKHVEGAMVLWGREAKRAADAAGKLTKAERETLNTRIWHEDLEVAVTERWGYRIGNVMQPSAHSGCIVLTVAEDATEDETYDALWLLWDHFKHSVAIDAATLRPLVERAMAEADQHKMPFARLSADELMQFVHGYLAGTVYTLEDVRDMASMVFMPLMFGAFSLPEGTANPLDAWMPKVGDEPKWPARPTDKKSPSKPSRPAKPKEPTAEVPDPETMQGFADLSWDDPDGADAQRATYLSGIQSRNEAATAAWRTAVAQWEADVPYRDALAKWKQTCKQVDADNKQAQEDHRKVVDVFKTTHSAWERADRLDCIVRGVFSAVRLQDLGTVWADTLRDNPMPRSINGLPMFSSCRLLAKADYAVARKMIDSEIQRREAQKQELDALLAAG